jgi:hypothetical protein
MLMTVEQTYYEQVRSWEPRILLENPHEIRRFTLLAAAVPKGAQSLLDIGAGNGVFLKFLEDRGHPPKLAGIERSAAAVKLAVCRTEIQTGEANVLP